MPHDLIVFGEDWGRHPSSTQHLVSRLARDRKVVWVNSLGLRRPRIDASDLRRLGYKALHTLRPAPDGVAGAKAAHHPFDALVAPRAIPWPGSRLAAMANRQLVGAQLRKAMDGAAIKRPVLWTSLPTALPLVGSLGERAVVYYAGDDFAALHGVDHKPVLAMELELARKANLILAASHEIATRFDPAKTMVLPHGVDFDLFSRPQRPARNLPSGKVAGFYGSINGWIDLDAVAAAARKLSNWTFVLIGRVETDLSPLAGLANVRLEPAMAHGALPAWSQHWTVAMLPFRRNRQIEASNPLKLREYLATGNPVAATYAFPAISGINAPVATPDSGEDLGDAILKAEARREAFRTFAPSLADESWDARANQLARLIDSL